MLRRDQEETVRKILNVLEKHRVAVLRAPTGFGKTLTGLEVARRFNDDTLIAVRTRNQLSRYIEDMAIFYREVPRVLLNRLLTCFKYGQQCNTCIFNNVLDQDEVIMNKLFDPYDRTVQYYFRSRGACIYRTYLSFDSDITVCTYPFIINPRLRKRLNPSLVIIDEAHNLESLVSISVDYSKIIMLLEKILNEVKRRNIKDSSIIQSINYIIRNVRNIKSLDNVGKIVEEFYNIFELLYRDSSPSIDTAELFIEVISSFETALELGLDYITIDENVIMFRSLDLSMIGKFLDNFDKVLLMSATLPDKWFLRNIWNIRDLEVIEVEYRYPNTEAIIISEVTSRYDSRSIEMYRKYGKLIDNIFKQAEKIMLVFFPSREFMNNVLKHVSSRYITGQSIGEIIKQAYNSKVMIVDVVGGRLSEGVELVDRSCRRTLVSDVVIVGVPYPKYDTYMRRLLKQLEDRGIRPEVYLIEKAWMGIRQAVGRATRMGYEGRVRIWLLDSRYLAEVWVRKIRSIVNSVKVLPACSLLH